MKPETHKLADEITYGLGPLFRANPEYGTILSAMCVVMARVIQSTPEKGREARAYEYACEQIGGILSEFLRVETKLDAEKESQKEKLDSGISGFDKFAKQDEAECGYRDSDPTEEEAKDPEDKIVQFHNPEKEA